MPHPGRNNIYDATIKRMVNETLEAQEQEFAQNRGGDSDEQMLAYLQFCAELLGHTPWPREIVGGSLIENRFGSWEKALAKAKLPKPITQDKLTGAVHCALAGFSNIVPPLSPWGRYCQKITAAV